MRAFVPSNCLRMDCAGADGDFDDPKKKHQTRMRAGLVLGHVDHAGCNDLRTGEVGS